MLDQIKEQLAYKKLDLVLPCSFIHMQNGKLYLKGLSNLLHDAQDIEVQPTKEFLNQFSEKLGMSITYQDRLLDGLEYLYESNMNELLKVDANKSFLIRISDNKARAFLSNSFKIIDHLAIVNELEKLQCTIDDYFLSESNLYIYASRGKEKFYISNSETGHGKFIIARRLQVQGVDFILGAKSKKHLGSRIPNGKTQGAAVSINLPIVDHKYINELNQIEIHIDQELNNPLRFIHNLCKYLSIEQTDDIVKSFSISTTIADAFNAVSASADLSYDLAVKFSHILNKGLYKKFDK